MKLISQIGVLLIAVAPALAQQNPVAPTPADLRLQSVAKRTALQQNSLAAQIPMRSIGPWVQSGRVVDVDVNPTDPSIFYTAYASGGLWKTESNGTSFIPVFDNQPVMTIGDIAVDWSRNTIWIGTGENNASRSSYAGMGMYKSADGGKNWQYMGLAETHHIGRVVIHPKNPNIIWVAAVGHLYSPNKERGVYMTVDGGKTWQQTLFVNENTGAIDLVVDERNPNTLYAAMWEKERRAWRFEESGAGTGIYKSTDGGKTWRLTTGANSGFPFGNDAGRIGLAWVQKGGQSLVFAMIDNQQPRPKKEADKKEVLNKENIKTLSKEAFLAIDKKDVASFLSRQGFPAKYKADDIIEMVKNDKITVKTLADYIDTGDDGFSNNDIHGAEVYVSADGGASWKKTHQGNLDNLVFTYGYYFSQIRVNANNPDKLYIMGTRIAKSDDGGKNWVSINRENVHWDHHALWVNPNRTGHLINGNDGGINISYDDGKTWFKANSPSVGQFYHVSVDMQEPYNVYGGLQDNGVWFGSSQTTPSNDWHDSGENPFKQIGGGDGMQTAVDTRDNTTVYYGSQFGYYNRRNLKGGRGKMITPRHNLGEKPLRFNWQTPIQLSVHNQDVLYFGANKLYRSFDKGDNWEAISGDLTQGAKKGNVPYGTLTAVHESSMKFGLIYTGSDDGLVHVTKDGGVTWQNISSGLPADLWVTRVQASAHDKARVYVALNGYRWDDFTPYLYVSNDYGQTWTRLGQDLPHEPINVVKEDPKNPDLLYVGSDNGLYISLDKGQSFMTMGKDFPAVAVHDVVVHPRDRELVVGTHGRSIYVANVAHLQELTAAKRDRALVAFDLGKTRAANWGNNRDQWADRDEPTMSVPVYVKTAGTVSYKLLAKDMVLKTWSSELKKGLNYDSYDFTIDEKMANTEGYVQWLNQNAKEGNTVEVKRADDGRYYIQKGKYVLEITKEGVTERKELIIE